MRLATQGGCGQIDLAIEHDEAEHLERCARCGKPLAQPHEQPLAGSYEED